jgi:hypothetical protein
MPFLKLTFKPGINRDTTNYAGEGGWWDCDKVRFYSGFPQKLGGWIEATSEKFFGTCRQMKNWITSYSDSFLALGTNEKVYIEVGGIFYDITPLRATTSAGDVTFAASSGSSTITVTDTNFGSSAGDYVTFSGAVSLGGNITATVLNQNYQIATVIDPNNYTIEAKDTSGAAVVADGSDSGNGGAAVVGEYEIAIGNASLTLGYGWGSGPWNGSYGWGLASPVPVTFPSRDWFFDNFDNDLIMNIRQQLVSSATVGGPIYYWVRGTNANPTTSLETRAVTLQSLATTAGYDATWVPTQTTQVLVSQNDKHLLAFGADIPATSADFDPLLIRWASQDVPEQWEPQTTNTAGFIRVSKGSRIIRAIPTRQEIIVFTDTSMYSLQFTGTTDVFSLQELGNNTSIMSSRAVATANNVIYWMGQDKFYFYDGRVQTLPTTVREYVFKDISFSNADQVISGTNEGFNEIWWFYPSLNSNWNDRYVIYNYLENTWYFGNLSRTAWLDTPLRAYPTAVYTPEGGNEGTLYTHEFGINDAESPMVSYIQSNDFDIDDGEKFFLTRRLIPDVNFNQSTANIPEVDIAIRPRNFPGSQYENDPSDTQNVIQTSANIYTDQIFLRARARQMAFKIASDQLGVQWQLGVPRLDVREDGKR